jgi:glycosyltransferase involved in cell wall biosynthesis
MRIAIDAREIHGKPTGVGRYLNEILAAWSGMPEARPHDIVLFGETTGGSTLWEQFTLPGLVRSARADVLFAPGYTGPLRTPVPMVVTIHDVSFAAHPEWFRWREGLRRRTLTRMAANRASRVLTVSEFSKREIVAHLGIDDGKIEVIYSGIRALHAARIPDREPLVLFVGSVFNRRHVPELIEGFSRLARRNPAPRLAIVGDNRTAPHVDIGALARASGVGDRIEVRAYANDIELASLYRRTSAFAFLSSYEGFGFPPLEALSAGVPVVVLDTPVAREIYGPAALYVEKPDPSSVEVALERALFDVSDRERVMNAAPAVLARYSWRDCSARVLRALEAAAGRRA